MDREHRGRDRQSRVGAASACAPGIPGKRTLTESLSVDGVAPSNATARPPGKRTLTEGLPIQRAALSTTRATRATADGNKPSGGSDHGPEALPAPVRNRMESAFGFHLGHVRVHQGSSKALAMGAAAYTQGADIHFAPGTYDPSSARGQELIGHELAHVIQQSEGRVHATRQAKGMGVNDDEGLEREADDWGARAARGEPVGRGGAASGAASGAPGPVQRKRISSHWGDFEDANYRKSADGHRVDIELTFQPGEHVDATKIGLAQSLKNVKRGVPDAIDPTEKLRMVRSGPNAGNKIDRLMDRTNPIYGSKDTDTSKLEATKETNAPPGTVPDRTNATYKLGHHYTDAGSLKHADAWMHDKPASDRSPNSGMEFETAALAIDGAQRGTYYGSVRWGFRVNGAGELTTLDLALVSPGTPSQRFLAAASGWNQATARGTIVASGDNAQLYDESMKAAFRLPKDTPVEIIDPITYRGVAYSQVRIQDGHHAGKTGYVKTAKLTDKGDGKPTTDLPVPEVQVLTKGCEMSAGATGPSRESHTLAKGTRVLKARDRHRPPSAEQVWVEVIDGPAAGAEGYIACGKLTPEQP